MAFTDEVLAEIQDPAQKEAFRNLPPDVLKTLEKRATLAVDAQQKLERLEATEQTLEKYREADKGWATFKAYCEKNGVPFSTKMVDEFNALRKSGDRVRELEAEVAKLKPEAERAAVLAKQVEGDGTVDPAKIEEMVLAKAKGQFISKDDIKAIVADTLKQAQDSVSMGIIPSTVSLVEHAIKAHRDYGLDISSDTLAAAAQKYPGRPDAIELAYNDLTKAKREELAAKSEADKQAKIKADIEAARKEGAEQARREYETNYIQGEDAGRDSMLGVQSLNSPPKERQGVNPTTYDPGAGVLAQKALGRYRQLEQEGFHKLM